MKRTGWTTLALVVGLAACQNDVIYVEDDVQPAAPVALDATYYAYAVTVSWELGGGWNGEAFRVYGKRATDANYFLIAEVTSCSDGLCRYQDTNVVGGETYDYTVSAVSRSGTLETFASVDVSVFVPMPVAPAVPDGPFVVALDNTNYLSWGTASRADADFSHYKVYQDLDGTEYLLGETDSEGFLDQLAANGSTYSYFVTAVDTDGHESSGSALATGTPRPDFHGEWVYDHLDQPTLSGFRFQADEGTDPIVSGTDAARHFRLETDASGWWLVPGPTTAIYPTGFPTTALKCGVAADAFCVDVSTAPTSGYGTADVPVFTQESYVFRVIGDDGLPHYGVIRVELLGFDQDDNAIMIFDWAYQLQSGNPDLVVGVSD